MRQTCRAISLFRALRLEPSQVALRLVDAAAESSKVHTAELPMTLTLLFITTH